MRSQELSSQLQAIHSLIANTEKAVGGNLELQRHWAKYLCVLVAGFFENAMSEVYIDFVNHSASPPVAGFARRTLEQINNPKSNKFVEIARAFKREWGYELEDFFNQSPQRKDAIDSIMNNRHLVAHGKTSAITVVRVKEYLNIGVEVIEFIEKQCQS
jgi:RiboL-PSP-HEPN